MIEFLLIILAILIVVGLVIYGVYKFSKIQGTGVPPNSPLIELFGTKYSSGYSTGVMVDMKRPLTGDSVLCEMKPLDVPYDKRGKPVNVENVKFAVKKELITEIPAGANSMFRGKIYIMPESPLDLDPVFRNTIMGTSLAYGIIFINKIDKSVEAIRTRQSSEKTELALLEKEENEIINMYREELKKMTESKLREKGEPNISKVGTTF